VAPRVVTFVIELAVSGKFLMTANSPEIDFRDSGIFVVVGRLSANRWAQYPRDARSHAAVKINP
jgi:hypothetical protein